MKTLISLIIILFFSASPKAATNCEEKLTGGPFPRIGDQLIKDTQQAVAYGNCATEVPEKLSKVKFNAGDFIFISSTSSQSDMLQIATASSWTHVGMIVMKNGLPYVLEASSTVKYTPVKEFVAKSRGYQVSVKRSKDKKIAELSSKQINDKIIKQSASFLGKPYDVRFEWGDDKIYCSELTEKIYNRVFGINIGEVENFGKILGIDSNDPEWIKKLDPIVRDTLLKRYESTKNVNLKSPVVTPVAQHRSPNLQTIFECAEATPVPLNVNGRDSE